VVVAVVVQAVVGKAVVGKAVGKAVVGRVQAVVGRVQAVAGRAQGVQAVQEATHFAILGGGGGYDIHHQTSRVQLDSSSPY
jgi:hypothetical protein